MGPSLLVASDIIALMATLSDSDRSLLRLYVGDPAGPDEVLSDSVLDELYDGPAEGSIEGAAARAWRIKAATVTEWYMTNVDGAFLSRDQVFDHCVKMAGYYEGVSGTSFAMINVGLSGPNAVSEVSSSEF